MSIIDNATTKDVQNVINGVTPPTYSNEAGKTTSAISITVNGSTRTFNGSEAVNLGSIYAPTSAGSNGQVLVSGGGVGQAPTWQNERIASVNDSSSRGQAIYVPTSRGTDGYVWEAQGGSQSPSWQQPIITSVNGSQNRGQSIYVPTSQGSNGQVWTSTGGTTPAWSTPIITSLNGSQSNGRSIYAPTSAGSSGQVLKSNGSGAPTFKDLFTVRSAAYTRESVTGGTTIELFVGETGERSLKIISFTAKESAETGYFEVRTSRDTSGYLNKLGAVGGQDGQWGAQNLSLTVCVPPDSECYLVNCWNLEVINYTVTTISW